ncbi:IS1595 family transposase [Mucilaginibacter sp.]|uniref:IS1595 family transposase n=1 Tax=Mucilaginibacter sp. TaxID=1882438 RepID=UPI002631C44C|nr:IS1595 family transposase [Mucilaginibacter sp.]MDB4925797.1 family transposase [Mucilaginibacter sp.]
MEFDFKSILDLVKAFPDEATCIAYLEEMRWNGVIVSPFDETSKVYKCAGAKFKCKNTGKYFNAKVGTIFEDSKIPLIKWYMALYLFSSHKKGISSHQLSRDIDVTQKTAWFMLHRLRFAFNTPAFKKQFDGVVEVDETYVGGKDFNKHEHKRNGKSGRSLDAKAPVFGMKDRKSGNVVAMVVPNVKRETLIPILQNFIMPDSIVITDNFKVYDKLNLLYSHARVNHSAKEYVNGIFHTNGIENFWSHLKRGVDGIYHWVSVTHLQAYVNEYTLRYNTRKFTTSGRFDLVLANVAGRLTYKELTK